VRAQESGPAGNQNALPEGPRDAVDIVQGAFLWVNYDWRVRWVRRRVRKNLDDVEFERHSPPWPPVFASLVTGGRAGPKLR
jgi:hypothetical protein